ncbi:MAG: ATP-binding protein [Thiolinea sp.]
MIRLFLSLFAVITIVIISYLMGANPVAHFLLQDTLADLRQQQLGGIIVQLDEDIAGLNASQRQQRLREIKAMFRYDLELVPIAKLDVSPRTKKRLQQGHFVSHTEQGVEYINYRAGLDGYAWHMQLDPSLEDQYQDFLTGPLALLEQKLSESPRSEWPQVVQHIDSQFGIPIRLIDQQAIDNHPRLDQRQRTMLNAGEMVMLSEHPTEAEYIYYRLKDSNAYLEVGKLQVPFALRNANLIILSLLAALLGLAIWLWLRPVWQELRQLKSASEGFGQGQLTTRIPVSRYSFIKTILQAFNTMAGRIEQLITSHQTLTNAVSHELRTPVSRLRFSLAMLEKTEQSDTQRRHLAEMNDDIDELDEMLAALLSYARMDRQDVIADKTPLLLEPWLREQITHLRLDNDHIITIEVICLHLPDDEAAVMDAKLMARALQNLLQNAKRYARQKIRVTFSKTGEHYELRVDDDGCGIPEQYRERLFDPFTRVDESRGRDSGGYGLGLAIVKQIVHMHRGEVSVCTSELGGACFTIHWQCC